MSYKILCSFIVVILVMSIPLHLSYGQKLKTQGRFTHSVYSYEDTRSHTRLYQTLLMETRYQSPYNIKLNLALRAMTDLNQSIDRKQRFNAYRLSVSGNGLFNKLLDFEIGRQFIHPGLPLGSVDGLNLNSHLGNNLEWQIFGGIEPNYLNDFSINTENNYRVYGSTIFYKMEKRTVRFAYLNKSRKNIVQWQLGGVNIIDNSIHDIRLSLETHYDFVNERMHRIYFSSCYSGFRKIKINIFFKEQYPQIYSDSFFRIFKVYKYRQLGLNSYLNVTDKYYLSGGYRYLQIEKGNAHLFEFLFGNANGTLGVIHETGDLGKQTSFLFDYNHEFSSHLSAAVAIDYTRYRLEEIYDLEKQLANTFRISYNAKKHWLVDIEYQWLNNRYMEYDHRILNHIHFIW
jgi:hypothetical protein